MTILDLFEVINELKNDVSSDYKTNNCFLGLRDDEEDIDGDLDLTSEDERERANNHIFETIPYAREERARIYEALELILALIVFYIKGRPPQLSRNKEGEMNVLLLYLIGEALKELGKVTRARIRFMGLSPPTRRAIRENIGTQMKARHRKVGTLIELLKSQLP